MNFGFHECTEISLAQNHLISYYIAISSCFEACAWCPKISSSRSLCKRAVLYPAKNEEIYGIAIVPYQYFSCYVALLIKRNLQHVGHKWVICGSHPDCSVGQQVRHTFNPDVAKDGSTHKTHLAAQLYSVAS